MKRSHFKGGKAILGGKKKWGIRLFLTVTVSLAVNVTLFALAVMAGAVGSLDDTSGAMSLVTVAVVAVARGGLSARSVVQKDKQDEEEGGTRNDNTAEGAHFFGS